MDVNAQTMDSISDLRHRIQLTEHALLSLNSMEERTGPAPELRFTRERPVSPPESVQMPVLTLRDLSPETSVHSHGFGAHQETHSKNTSYQRRNPDQAGAKGSASVWRSSSQKSLASFEEKAGGSGSAASRSMDHFGAFEEENLSLRKRLQQVREENAHLVSQNHSILNQLEAGSHQLRKAQAKIEQLSEEIGGYQTEEKRLQELVAKLNEDHLKQMQQSENLAVKVQEFKRLLSESTAERTQARKQVELLYQKLQENEELRTRSDQDRNRAIEAAEKIKTAYERFQKKMEGKLSERERTESHMKESIQHLSAERESLMKTCSSLKEQVNALVEETRQLADDILIEKEHRCQAEANNLDLRMEAARYSQAMADVEKQLSKSEAMQQEIFKLRQRVQEQEKLLREYETKLENNNIEHQKACLSEEEEEPSDLVQPDSSRSVSGKNAYSEIIHQLSQQLAAKEVELQALKQKIPSDTADQLNNSLKALENDLKSSLSKKTEADAHCLELEAILASSEEDRDRLSQQILQLQQKLGEDEEEKASLSIKLEHRGAQVEELQREMGDKNKELATVQRELRKCKSQIATLERQLNDKVYEVTQQKSQLSEVEGQLKEQAAILDASRKGLIQEREAAAKSRASMQEMKELHRRQCQELQAQVDKLQDEWQVMNEEQEAGQRKLASLQNLLKAQEAELSQVKEEREMSSAQAELILLELQKKTTQASEQMADLEAALAMTKQELEVQVEQAQETKAAYEAQLSQKQQQVESAELQLRQNLKALKSKTEEVVSLEQDLNERQKLLEAANSRLEELEESHQTVDAQICSLERQVEEARNKGREELVRYEHRLRMADEELERKQAQVQALHQQLEEKNQNALNLSRTVDDLQADLKRGSSSLKTASDHVEKLEADLKLTRDQVEEQMAKVEILEEELSEQKTETEEKRAKLEEIMAQLTKARADLRQSESKAEDLTVRLSAAEELVAKEKETIIKLSHSLKQKEDEARSKGMEISQLDEELKQRHHELQERITLMTELDMQVREHSSQTEQRLTRLEGALRQSQVEATERGQQVALLDEELQRLRGQLREKGLQLQEAHQHLQQAGVQAAREGELLKGDLVNASQEVERIREENSQLKQELILSREDHKKLSLHAVEVQRELSMSQRDRERLKDQVEQLKGRLEAAEKERDRLAEDLQVLKTKEAQLKAQAEADARKFKRQLELQKEKHAKEVAGLQQTQSLLATSQKEMGCSYQMEIEQLRNQEEGLKAELQHAKSEISVLKEELSAGQTLLQKASEDIVIKESESARLQAKVSGLQRSLMQLSRCEPSSSFMPPSQSTSINTHHDTVFPDIDLSAISLATSKGPDNPSAVFKPTTLGPMTQNSTQRLRDTTDLLSLQRMLQEVNQMRLEEEASKAQQANTKSNSADELLLSQSDASKRSMDSKSAAGRGQLPKAVTKAKQNKPSTKKAQAPSKHKAPKPKVKPGSSHPKNSTEARDTNACAENVRARLQALMGKVKTMTVETMDSGSTRSQDSDEEDLPSELELVPKKYSPELPEKSFDVSSAIEHYDARLESPTNQISPHRLDFDSGSSSHGTETGKS